MAIDPKELRIGSHINVKGVRVVVDEITNTTLVAYVTPDNDWEATDPTEEWIDPIPITPELLTELGFEYRESTYFKHWFKGGFDLERNKGSKYFDYSSELRLEYLHELENLYYMIYGVELITD